MDDDHFFFVRVVFEIRKNLRDFGYFIDGLIGMAAASCVIGVTILKSRNVSF